jgi:CRP-like cAMP-binding protein
VALSSALHPPLTTEGNVAEAQNRILEALPHADRLRLLADCEPCELLQSQVLYEHGDPLRDVYFPVDGSIALVSEIDGHPGVEVGLVGREGLVGAHLALGVAAAPMRAVVQGAGSSLRLASATFSRELARKGSLHRNVDAYVYVLIEQMAAAVACRRFHLIAPRLARWLLMSQDRAHADQFHITHEFLAYMLGVRRVGVTVAAGELQRAGLIAYHRGEVAVLDRPGLQAAACSCYATDLQAYERRLA